VPWFDERYFHYDRLVGYYRRLFGPEQVLAQTLDQFVADGRAFVERIAEFAGRPVPAEVLDRLPYTSRENARAVSMLTLEATRPLNFAAKRSEINPAPSFHSGRARRLADRLRQDDALNRPLTKRLVERRERALRDAIEQWAGDRFVEGNRRLQELVGADLGAFGWRV
jgi:hypothetical protein